MKKEGKNLIYAYVAERLGTKVPGNKKEQPLPSPEGSKKTNALSKREGN